jgi:hypothetical protein
MVGQIPQISTVKEFAQKANVQVSPSPISTKLVTPSVFLSSPDCKEITNAGIVSAATSSLS